MEVPDIIYYVAREVVSTSSRFRHLGVYKIFYNHLLKIYIICNSSKTFFHQVLYRTERMNKVFANIAHIMWLLERYPVHVVVSKRPPSRKRQVNIVQTSHSKHSWCISLNKRRSHVSVIPPFKKYKDHSCPTEKRFTSFKRLLQGHSKMILTDLKIRYSIFCLFNLDIGYSLFWI